MTVFGYLSKLLLNHFFFIGVFFGTWSIYNATHSSRQNNVANFAVNKNKSIELITYVFLFCSFRLLHSLEL